MTGRIRTTALSRSMFEGAGPGLSIQGNKIGTNAAGTAAIPNGGGIYIDNADGFLIGGTAAGAGNLISGNVGSAITIGSTIGGHDRGQRHRHRCHRHARHSQRIHGDVRPDRGPRQRRLERHDRRDDGRRSQCHQRQRWGWNPDQRRLMADLWRTESDRRRREPGQHGRRKLYRHQGRRQWSRCPTRATASTSPTTALSTVIGGTATGAGNVISGNTDNGVLIDGTGLPAETLPLLEGRRQHEQLRLLTGHPVRRQRHARRRRDLWHGRHRRGLSVQRHGRRACRRYRYANYLAATAVTLSAWINLSSLPGATPYVIASRAYSATSENYGLYVNSSGELVFEWYSAGAFHTETSSGADLGSRLGVFQQVAVVTRRFDRDVLRQRRGRQLVRDARPAR